MGNATTSQVSVYNGIAYTYDDNGNIQTRYYNPRTGRFINADAFAATGQGLLGNNMFAYCLNNPIICCDDAGSRCVLNAAFAGESQSDNPIDEFLHGVNDTMVDLGVDTAALGAAILGFYQGDVGVYHAKSNCWQQYFGYNGLYDAIFDIGTSMLAEQFYFTHDATEYVIWVWKGDYINLGAGAEIGIYLWWWTSLVGGNKLINTNFYVSKLRKH